MQISFYFMLKMFLMFPNAVKGLFTSVMSVNSARKLTCILNYAQLRTLQKSPYVSECSSKFISNK